MVELLGLRSKKGAARHRAARESRLDWRETKVAHRLETHPHHWHAYGKQARLEAQEGRLHARDARAAGFEFDGPTVVGHIDDLVGAYGGTSEAFDRGTRRSTFALSPAGLPAMMAVRSEPAGRAFSRFLETDLWGNVLPSTERTLATRSYSHEGDYEVYGFQVANPSDANDLRRWYKEGLPAAVAIADAENVAAAFDPRIGMLWFIDPVAGAYEDFKGLVVHVPAS